MPELVLVGITILWGGTFLTTKIGLAQSGPLFFVGVRFASAAALLAVVSPHLLTRWTRTDIIGSGAIGLSMVAGYALQTIGLETIPSSVSALLTALYVPFVPILQLILFRRVPRPMVWIGIGTAFAGLVLLAGPSAIASLSLGRGEIISIFSALAFSVQIILIGRFASRIDPRRAAFLQLAIVGVGCLALMPATGEPIPEVSPTFLACALGLGTISALIQVAMNWGQGHVSPSRATLIYAAEPVYAGIIGRLAGDRLTSLSIVGGVLIIASVVVSELRWSGRRRAAP